MNTGDIWGNRSQSGRESKLGHNSINKAKGFTLVELIVVLVILTILAAIAIPTFMSFIDKAKEKNAKMAGQKALAATQSALSDIYSDASSRFSPDKRANTRALADVDTAENNSDTAFTVWNEKKLWDGHTVAIAENVGSYTVSKALYREGNIYAAFNGKEWETFNKEDQALAWLNIGDSANDLTDNVIHVWPYADDYAYVDIVTPSDDDNGPGKESVLKEVTLKIPRTYLPHVFFSKEGRSSNSGKESVKVVFWKESESSSEIKSYWTIDGNNKNLFKVDEYNTYWLNIVNTENHTFRLTGWQLEDGSWETADIGKDTLQGYIFSQTDQNKFTFVALIDDNEFIAKIATLSKTKFRDVIGSKSISSVEKTTGGAAGAYDEEMVKGLGAVRVDEERDGEKGKIYAWESGGVLHWWTDADIAYLPEDCSNFLTGKTVTSFDFSGFDAARITSMYYFFVNNTALTNVKFGSNFHAGSLENTLGMFEGCENLTSADLANFNAENGTVTNVSYMFKNCKKLPTIEFGDFSTVNTTDWKYMFHECNAATTINVSSLETDSAVDMQYIFNKCSSVQQLNLSGWNMNKVTNLTYAFNNDRELTKITFGDGWKLDSCQYMMGTFEYCPKLTNDFSEIKTSQNLKDIKYLFHGCEAVTAFNTKEWDVSGVETMESVFQGCIKAKTIDVSNWKTTNLKNLKNTFTDCKVVEKIDMSNWNMEKVTTMEGTFKKLSKLQKVEMGENGWNLKECPSLLATFEDCAELNQSFDKLQTSSALTNMDYTFNRCHALTDLDLRRVNAEGVTSLYRTFKECEKLQTVDVSTWNTIKLTEMHETFFGDKQLTYLDMGNWKMNKIKAMYKTFNQLENLETIVTGTGWQFDECESFEATFERCKALRTFDASNMTTSSKLKVMNHVFSECSSLTRLDLSGWNVSGVTTMYRGFNKCTSLATLDVSTWNTPSVTNLAEAFNECTALQTIDMRTWDMSSVTDAYSLFRNDSSLTKIRMGSGWHFDNCERMYNAFYNCTSLNQDFHEISTSDKLKNIASIFEGMTAETRIDLRNWNLTGVNDNCVNAFRNCSALRRVYANPDTCFVATSEQTKNMFNGCNNLEGGNGTTLAKNGNKIIAEFAWVDGALKDGVAQVGYFTDKPTAAKLRQQGQGWVYDNIKIGGKTAVTRTQIQSINRNTTLDEDQVLAIAGVAELSDPGFTEGYPVYFWVDSSKNIQWWCEAENVFVHEDATQMFTGWNNAQISLDGFDLSLVRDFGDFFKEDYKMTSVDLSGQTLANVTNLSNMFNKCTALTSVNLAIDTSNSEGNVSVAGMFGSDTKLQDVTISGDGSKIASTVALFKGLNGLTSVDLGGLSLSGVSDMTEMFRECSSLQTVELSVDTSNLTADCSLSNMFKKDTALQSVNVSVTGGKVSNLQSMFDGCTNLTDISGLYVDASNSADGVITKNMFTNCRSLGNVSLDDKLILNHVTNMEAMFSYCTEMTDLSFTINTMPDPGTGSVNVNQLFYGNTKLKNITIKGTGNGITAMKVFTDSGSSSIRTVVENVDMSEFELNSIQNMERMFENCSNLQSAKLKIDTSDSTNVSMYRMFFGCHNVESVQIVGVWDNVTSIESMFGVSNGSSISKLAEIDFGTTVNMTNLRTAKHLFENVSNQQNADRLFDAFAATFAVWDINDIFEKRDNNASTYKNRITTVNTIFNGKQVTNKNGKVYKVQDNKYFCNHL